MDINQVAIWSIARLFSVHDSDDQDGELSKDAKAMDLLLLLIRHVIKNIKFAKSEDCDKHKAVELDSNKSCEIGK